MKFQMEESFSQEKKLSFTCQIIKNNSVICFQRAIGEKEGSSTCVNSTPCGWAIYTPFTRKVDYFMKNT